MSDDNENDSHYQLKQETDVTFLQLMDIFYTNYPFYVVITNDNNYHLRLHNKNAGRHLRLIRNACSPSQASGI